MQMRRLSRRISFWLVQTMRIALNYVVFDGDFLI